MAYILEDRPQLDAMPSDSEDEIANRRYSKCQHRASGPYKVLRVQLHAVDIEEDSIPSTASIDRLTLSLTCEQVETCD